MNKKRLQRRFIILCKKYHFSQFDLSKMITPGHKNKCKMDNLQDQLSNIKKYTDGYKYDERIVEITEQIEIFEIGFQLGMSMSEIEYKWLHYSSEHRSLNRNRYKMPKHIRQDNKTYLNTSGGGCNRNTIRYPKKNRKTAWKRFYKLFPNAKMSKSHRKKYK